MDYREAYNDWLDRIGLAPFDGDVERHARVTAPIGHWLGLFWDNGPSSDAVRVLGKRGEYVELVSYGAVSHLLEFYVNIAEKNGVLRYIY